MKIILIKIPLVFLFYLEKLNDYINQSFENLIKKLYIKKRKTKLNFFYYFIISTHIKYPIFFSPPKIIDNVLATILINGLNILGYFLNI